MDANLRDSMLQYYDERAAEYEEAYVLGTGTASIHDPRVFQREAAGLGGIVERVARGDLIDFACGTGYWLAHYAERCAGITLFDQSERMLDECRRKTKTLGIEDRCTIVRGDVFEHELPGGAFECALVGFLLSHVTDEQEAILFAALERMLAPSGRFLILDSAWSEERARVNTKIEHQERRLNDGTRFEIYKRYFDRDDIARWSRDYNASISIEYFGAAFLAVSGRFTHGPSTSDT